jgi:hypothetical protein
MTAEVDLVVNCWERSYCDVLQPGVLAEIAESNRYPFARRVVLVNNVEDRPRVDALARSLVERGEIDAYHHVADRLDHALAITGVTREELGRIIHYSDCALVAVTLPGAPWVLYWDADVRLRESADWVTPALDLFGRDRRVMVANPAFIDATLEGETRENQGDWALGDGFSDQLFLARRAEFAAPIYHQRCLAELRYPLAHVGRVFESRVDAWMRHHGRLRATYRPLTYVHPPARAGASYPPQTSSERVRGFGVRIALAALRGTPRAIRPRCCRTVV